MWIRHSRKASEMGGSGTRIHTIWRGMKARCQSASSGSYSRYGARGVRVCEEWQRFLPFLDWALANEYADDREIDRIDSRGNYDPDNCRWVLPVVNRSRHALGRGDPSLVVLNGALSEPALRDQVAARSSVKLNDGRGLCILIRPSGRSSWQFRFTFAGKEQVLTLGRYPKLSLAEARELREVARRKLRRGVDPIAEKRRAIPQK